MTKYLIKKTTGEIFVWTETLAERDDMADYEPPRDNKVVQEVVEEVEPAKPELPSLDDSLAVFKAEVSKPKGRPKK